MKHRAVPIPFTDIDRGRCRWCGESITDSDGVVNKRRRWHSYCVAEYNLLVNPSEAVYKAANGKCAVCRTDGTGVPDRPGEYGWSFRWFDIDHIIPLIDGGSHGLGNLQLLCWVCHREKTARENSARKFSLCGVPKTPKKTELETM